MKSPSPYLVGTMSNGWLLFRLHDGTGGPLKLKVLTWRQAEQLADALQKAVEAVKAERAKDAA